MGKQFYSGNNCSDDDRDNKGKYNWEKDNKEKYNWEKDNKENDFDHNDCDCDELDFDDFNCFKSQCMECPKKRDIDKEIKEAFNDIFKELCDINKDIEKLNKLFCKLEKLLAEKGCLSSSEKALICNIKKDILALNCVLRETAKDIKCLEEMVF